MPVVCPVILYCSRLLLTSIHGYLRGIEFPFVHRGGRLLLSTCPGGVVGASHLRWGISISGSFCYRWADAQLRVSQSGSTPSKQNNARAINEREGGSCARIARGATARPQNLFFFPFFPFFPSTCRRPPMLLSFASTYPDSFW